MKYVFFFLSVYLISFNVSAQKSKKEDKSKKSKYENLSPQARHDAYLQNATNQKLLGWLSLGLGGSMIIGGTAKMLSGSFKDVSKTDIRLIWLPTVGALACIGSYFIVKNSKEKRKKAAMMLEQESAHIGHPQHIPIYYPTFGIRISID
ncbi:MAG: hypothetical protein ACK5BV_03020 [Bacteroidota bacterium]|jgi:hypothetical protein